MCSPNPVPNPAITPETGADNRAQGRSTIRFPYLDQDDAVGIAKKIFEVRGNACEKDALAAALEVSADGGGFNLRLVTAKMFGLISGEKEEFTDSTDLGLRVIDPKSEKAARSESLLVPLYKAIYEAYKGQMLPGNPALEAQIEKLGVAPKQKDKARQVFQRSATQAGYFAFGNNGLVQPQLKAGAADVKQQKTELEVNPGGRGRSKWGKWIRRRRRIASRPQPLYQGFAGRTSSSENRVVSGGT